jgi:thiamine biosynthesis lipoprotein
MSVTIIGAEATATDALSTSVFVMGVARGIELIDRLIGIDAIVVDGQGNVHMSEGLMPMTQTAEVAAYE